MRTAAVVLMLALAGCKTAPTVQVPEVVRVTVREYVPVPDELTRPCPIEQPKAQTYGEAIRLANVRKAALVACNGQLDAIRSLR